MLPAARKRKFLGAPDASYDVARSRETRVAEYVDSETLAFRVKVGKTIACRIFGNYGVYLTTADLRSKRDGSCTCPSDGYPCKHIEALRLTYEKKPRTFEDVDALLKDLARRHKDELLDLVREMILRAPTALGALGIKGFDEHEVAQSFTTY